MPAAILSRSSWRFFPEGLPARSSAVKAETGSQKLPPMRCSLIIPIALLGMVALLSNILSIINIRNVNSSASNIADNYMDGKSRLAQICQTSMDIHKMALSHIVATDYDTMIVLVQQIKDEERVLDEMLAEYEGYVMKAALRHSGLSA